jgi:hypothetical protein
MSTPQPAAAPFTFIATYGVAEGHEGPLAELATDYVAELDAAEPRTHALGLYLDAERGTITHVQMLADSAAMEAHLEAIQGYLARAAEHLWIRSIDVFGEAGPRLRAALDHNAGAGAALLEHVGPAFGFGRATDAVAAGA